MTFTTAPVKMLREKFGDFLEKCKEYKEELLQDNNRYLWNEVLSEVCDKKLRPQIIEVYSEWMDQTWIRELIWSALNEYEDDLTNAEAYVPAWTCLSTYRIYKLFSMLITSAYMYDDTKKIAAFAKYKKIVDRPSKYITKHWDKFVQLFEEGKFIPTHELCLYKFDFGSIAEYENSIDATTEISKQKPLSSLQTPTAVPDSTTPNLKAVGRKRWSKATSSTSSPSAVKKSRRSAAQKKLTLDSPDDKKDASKEATEVSTGVSSFDNYTPREILDAVAAVKHLPLETQNLLLLHMINGSKR